MKKKKEKEKATLKRLPVIVFWTLVLFLIVIFISRVNRCYILEFYSSIDVLFVLLFFPLSLSLYFFFCLGLSALS